uniref:Vacuolar protein sorting-associated protein 8 central domain-containing protein n=1 Tax=Latimeria chalumnae TaxID=7897 RepID=H2ZS31_LATCH
MEEHFQKTVPLGVKCCILFDKTELLFRQLYDQLSVNGVALGVLLESLEPHILSGRLKSSMPPYAVKDLVVHYEDKRMLGSLELLVAHMDITSLDLHQIVTISKKHQLFDALIYAYNKGMNDYITPLEEMIRSVNSGLKRGAVESDEVVTVGNKALVYISPSCCLSGRAYPRGSIPADLVPVVNNEVFNLLTRLHSKDADPCEEPYPCVRTLLKYNTREFLNVLALTHEHLKKDKQAVQFQQRITDVLLQVITRSQDKSPIFLLETFLTESCSSEENFLAIPYKKVLTFLCTPEDESLQEESQQALLELLHAGGVTYFDEDQLVSLAENVKFYQVCKFVYERRRLYSKVINCYLKDPARKGQVFEYIGSILNDEEVVMEEQHSLKEEILGHIHGLLELSPRQTGELICKNFPDDLPVIIKTLQKNSRHLFWFLHGILNPELKPWPFHDASLLPKELHEEYIELLCQSQPDQVTAFLNLSEYYRTEEAIQIVEKHEMKDALAYLMEKQGNIQGAFTVLLEYVQERMLVPLHSNITVDIETKTLLDVQYLLMQLIHFCERNSNGLNSQQREELWFSLLELAMSPAQHLRITPSCQLAHTHSICIKVLAKKVLNSMTAYIPLTNVLQRIIQDPVYSEGKYGEVKDLVLGMMDKFLYEK